jgi:HK97 family phage major capsid protein
MFDVNKPSIAELQRLKRERKGIFNKAVEARGAAKEAGDETAETRSKIDAMLSEVEQYTAKIEQEERALAVADTIEEFEDKRADQDQETPEAKYSVAFRDFLQHGISEMSPENRGLLTQNAVDTRALGVASGGVGGYLVPEDFYNQVVEIMKAYGGMRAAGATILTTSGGNDIPIPKGDDTSNVGEIVGEGSQVSSDADPTFTQMVLKAYDYSSKIVRVGYGLLQDEAVGFEALLANMLATRIGRITNTHFTTGDDTGKPDGVLNSAADSSITSGKETSIAYADLVSLMHSIDPAYQANGRWMFNDGTLAMLKKMVTATEKIPLWTPGVSLREPDTILGKPYVVNQDMPAHTTGLKAMIFGDFSQYFIRDVRGAAMMRLTERYADYLQVGFMLFSRHDGGLAVPSAIKYLTVGSD